MGQTSSSFVSIYALVDPHTDEVRYIGRAVAPARRLRVHLRDTARTHKTNWLRQLDCDPRLMIIAIVTQADAGMYEVEMIRRARALGWPLTNATIGGEGQTILQPQRDAIAAANRRRIWTDVSRAKLSASVSAVQRGTSRSAETKAKISATQRGKDISDETRRRMSEGQLRRAMREGRRA